MIGKKIDEAFGDAEERGEGINRLGTNCVL
jgi:hypothetical protein